MSHPEQIDSEFAADMIAKHTREVSSEDLCTSPIVSVCVLTYNQEKLIREAIESVLVQDTKFPFEIVIGDDHSQDDTTEIVLEYQRNNPDRIRVLLAEENLGQHTGNGRFNFIRVVQACRGNYLALLEGDDYWTDSKKLQKQINALEEHPDWAICFHTTKIISENGKPPAYDFPDGFSKDVSTIEDLLFRNYIQTCSVVFRNELKGQFPEWYYRVAFGDWPLHVINAQFGDIGYLKETMAVYRRHASGIWTSRSQKQHKLAFLEAYDEFDHYLDAKYRDIVRQARREMVEWLCDEIDTLRNSRSYRLGKSIVWPLHRLWPGMKGARGPDNADDK